MVPNLPGNHAGFCRHCNVHEYSAAEIPGYIRGSLTDCITDNCSANVHEEIWQENKNSSVYYFTYSHGGVYYRCSLHSQYS